MKRLSETEKYIAELKKELPCKFKKDTNLIKEAISDLSYYNSNLSYNDIVDVFGEPCEAAKQITNCKPANKSIYKTISVFGVFLSIILVVVSFLYIKSNNTNKNITSIQFLTNKNGLSYGTAEQNIILNEPDLILAVGTNGKEGYIKKSDLYANEPKTPEEAVSIQENRIANNDLIRYIPLYKNDGETVIGEFKIDSSCLKE